MLVWLNFHWDNAEDILEAVVFPAIENNELPYLDVLGAYCLDNQAKV